MSYRAGTNHLISANLYLAQVKSLFAFCFSFFQLNLRTFQLKQELGACFNELSERDGFWLTPEGRKASVEPVDQADPASSVQSYECLVKALGRERRHGWR